MSFYFSLRNINRFLKLIKFFLFKNLSKKVFFKIFIFTLLLFIFLFIYFSSLWTQETFRKLYIEEILFSLYLPLENVEQKLADSFKEKSLFLNIKITLICFLIVFISFKNYHRKFFKYLNKFLVFLLLILGIFSFYKFYNVFRVGDIVKLYFSDSKYIEENYVDPRDVKIVFPKKKKNLIHIYLESMENSYFSKELGGAFDDNYILELSELLKEGVSFSNTNLYGGPIEVLGATNSVSGFVAFEAGAPLKVSFKLGGSYGERGTFLPGIITINDILKTQGYNTTFLCGSNGNFMGKGHFLSSHGVDKVMDLYYARNNKLIPNNYKVWWGYEDDKLYEYAKNEILRLHKLGKPFSVVIETVDTHGPRGYLSPKAHRKYNDQYKNVLRYSSKLLYDFINWAKTQDFYNDTVFVINGDHLYHQSDIQRWFPNGYLRTVYNVILNSDKKAYKTKNRLFTSFDFFPTILTSLGYKIAGDRLGLGTNLYANRKTLLERDGFDTMNAELVKNSNFFNKKFVMYKKEKLNAVKR